MKTTAWTLFLPTRQTLSMGMNVFLLGLILTVSSPVPGLGGGIAHLRTSTPNGATVTTPRRTVSKGRHYSSPGGSETTAGASLYAARAMGYVFRIPLCSLLRLEPDLL